MQKVYAVRIGRIPGIYTTWFECQKNISGFSGALYKSFLSIEEAKAFISIEKKLDGKGIDIYTDGSHKRDSNHLGIGAWCFYNDKEYSLSITISQSILLSYNINDNKVSNPTAELIAFAEVLKRLKNTPKGCVLNFHCDYLGVKNWIEGTWKAKENHIIKVRDVCLKLIQEMTSKINIFHVRGHSGNRGNDKADFLASKIEHIDDFYDLAQCISEKQFK